MQGKHVVKISVSLMLPRCLLELLAEFWPGIQWKIVFKFRLTAWTTEKEFITFVFDNDVSLTVIDAFTADRIFEHKSLLGVSTSFAPRSDRAIVMLVLSGSHLSVRNSRSYSSQ